MKKTANPGWPPANWLRFILAVWFFPRRYFEEFALTFHSGKTKEILLQASIGTTLSTLVLSAVPITALHLAASKMGWPWMVTGVFVGLVIGIGVSLYFFVRSPIQPVDLVILGTFTGLLTGIDFGFKSGFESGLRLDAPWGAGLGLVIGALIGFACGYRQAFAGATEVSANTRLLAFGSAAAATISVMDFDSHTIPAYFLALLVSMVIAIPAASLGHRWFRWRMGGTK